ncbi:MAG: iron ABC transporter permease [Candidatus Methanomethylophilaceae archaeon]|nr:iron ABC transporter permease [Candidatus Methanomethylophilaceae archaeon]
MENNETTDGSHKTKGYDRLIGMRKLYLVVAVAVCVLAFFVDLTVGSSGMSVIDAVRTLIVPDQMTAMDRLIIFDIRLPATVMAVAVGMSLALAGSVMQTILDNPMAEPYTLGISSSAGFGAALMIVVGSSAVGAIGMVSISAGAFACSMLACLVIYAVARFRSSDKSTILLTGIAIFFMFQALLSTMQLLANSNQLSEIVFWMFGSLARCSLPQGGAVILVLSISFLIFLFSSWKYTALKLGDAYASSLGVDVARLRRMTLIVVSVLTSVAVCFVGTIGFIGLIAPHISRFLVGEDHRYYIPMSMAVGAIILIAANMLSKVVMSPAIFPVGILTSFIGIPFFFYLVLSRRRFAS